MVSFLVRVNLPVPTALLHKNEVPFLNSLEQRVISLSLYRFSHKDDDDVTEYYTDDDKDDDDEY